MRRALLILLAGAAPLFAADLTVSAAASLQGPLDEAAKKFEAIHPGVHLALNFGASNALARQIENGAGVGVFLSADEKPVAHLKNEKLIVESRPFLANSLALIVPSENAASGPHSLADLSKPSLAHIAIGEPKSVPAGAYAMEALTHENLADAVAPRLVFAKDVRQALAYVASGNADAGIVYATDAATTPKVRIVENIPSDFHRPIVYPVALIKDTADARAFYDYLATPESLAVFEKAGFHAAPETP